MRKPGAPAGNKNAAKDVTLSDKIFITCRESDKAKWLAVAKMNREPLSRLVVRVMNNMAAVNDLPKKSDGDKGAIVHIRCLKEEKAAWNGLAENNHCHLSQLVRFALNQEADRVLALN